jgi:hypothetical protein
MASMFTIGSVSSTGFLFPFRIGDQITIQVGAQYCSTRARRHTQTHMPHADGHTAETHKRVHSIHSHAEAQTHRSPESSQEILGCGCGGVLFSQ